MLVGGVDERGWIVRSGLGFLNSCHPFLQLWRCSATLSQSESAMKRVSTLLACLLTLAVVLPAQADGRGHGGDQRGGHGFSQHYGGYGHHYRGSNHQWLAPVLGAALVGSVIYGASTPSYVVPSQVVVQQPYLPPSRVAYFCPTSQQYYPNVPTCQVPWQPMSY